MLSSRPSRVASVLVLLGLLFGLMVWYGSLEPDPSVWALPGSTELGTAYGQYVGERVSVWGRVVATDPLVITTEFGIDNELRLRLIGVEPSLRFREGMAVNVYGVVEPANTVRVLNVVRIPARGVWYTYLISFVAGLWVLGRIVRYWRLDVGDLAFERRAEQIHWREWLGSTHDPGAEDA